MREICPGFLTLCAHVCTTATSRLTDTMSQSAASSSLSKPLEICDYEGEVQCFVFEFSFIIQLLQVDFGNTLPPVSLTLARGRKKMAPQQDKLKIIHPNLWNLRWEATLACSRAFSPFLLIMCPAPQHTTMSISSD